MKRVIVLLSACVAISACSGFQTEPETEFVAAQEISPPPELYPDRRQVADETPPEVSDSAVKADADIDDYRWDGGSVVKLGEKQIRQLEIEKVHRLAKECIRANNASKACNDIVALDAELGKFFINQELKPYRR